MKKLNLPEIFLTLVTLLIGTVGFPQNDPSGKGRTQSFDQEWLFTRDNPTGAEKPDLHDSRWRTLNLPLTRALKTCQINRKIRLPVHFQKHPLAN